MAGSQASCAHGLADGREFAGYRRDKDLKRHRVGGCTGRRELLVGGRAAGYSLSLEPIDEERHPSLGGLTVQHGGHPGAQRGPREVLVTELGCPLPHSPRKDQHIAPAAIRGRPHRWRHPAVHAAHPCAPDRPRSAGHAVRPVGAAAHGPRPGNRWRSVAMRDAQIGSSNCPGGTESAVATFGGAAHAQLTLDAHEARVISGKDSDRWSRTSAWPPTSPVS